MPSIGSLLRGASCASSITNSTLHNSCRIFHTSSFRGLKSKRVTILPAPSSTKPRTFAATSPNYSFSSRAPKTGNNSYRGFSHSAAARERNSYRRFGQFDEPKRGWQGQAQSRLLRSLQSRVVLTVVGFGGGFYLYNLETVEVRLTFRTRTPYSLSGAVD
jgi:hypothetical protein